MTASWTRKPNKPGPNKGQFESKYHFSEVLTNLGDFVETEPIDPPDRKRIMDAAYDWAWQNNRIVTCEIRYDGCDMDSNLRAVRITLLGLTRKRNSYVLSLSETKSTRKSFPKA